MSRAPTTLIALIALAALVTTTVPATAITDAASDLAGSEKTYAPGFEYCGDVRPVFLNPDLQPRSDGFVHASGWFFIQFQVIAGGEGLDVERLSFSFGKPIPDELRTCETPEWITDAYYKDYRVDDDPSDGFFIPINTTNVPDGEWAAAISVYSGGEEVGRAFTRAIVNNGCMVRFGFDCDRASIIPNDEVRPWPIVLPGDGQQIHGGGLTIEFAEPVIKESVKAFIDGVQVPLTEMQPRTWDTDSIASALDEDAPACPLCEDTVWGPAFKYNGEVPEGAVISVQAKDFNNNTVSKILHITSSAVGGVISVQIPNLEIKIPEASKSSKVNQVSEFVVTFVNVGKDTAHTNLHVKDIDGLEVEWEPNHVVVPTGEEVTATLKAKGLQQGTYSIEAWAEYKAGTEDVTKNVPLTLQVGAGSEEVRRASDNSVDETLNQTDIDDEDQEGTPSVGALVTLGLVGAAALVARQRRDA